MLSEETRKQIESIGLNVETLQSALTSDEEVNLEIKLPTTEGYTQEQFDTLSKNRFEEGKSAALEIKAKELKKKLGIEIDGKNIDAVIEAYGSQVKAASGNDEIVNDLEKLRASYAELEEQNKSIHSEYANKAFQSDLRSKLLSVIPEGTTIPKEDIVNLYLFKNNIVNSEGTARIEKDGEILKDSVRNPLDVTAHFKSHLDSSNYIVKDGLSLKDSGTKPVTDSAKYSTIQNFAAWCKENNENFHSEKNQKLFWQNHKAK